MSRNVFEYWTVRKDYGGEAFYRLDREALSNDYGEPVMEVLMTFLAAHYKFNDQVEPATADEKVNLVGVMEQAKLTLSGLDPYQFVDSLNALQEGVKTGSTIISPRQNPSISYHGFH